MFENVFSNPYIIEKIISELDIRSLFDCFSLNKDFFDASVYEYEKRKDIIHLYLLRYDYNLKNCKDIQKLNKSFIQYTKLWLNIRPKNVIIFIGGYRHSTDYRLRENKLKNLCKYLPKDCEISFIDVGHSVLTSSVRFKTLTNYEEQSNVEQFFERTSFPCMSCLLFPQIKGIDIRVYESIDRIDVKNVKSILFFESKKHLERDLRNNNNSEESESKELIYKVIEKLGFNVAFGGGCVNATKTMSNGSPEEDILRKHLLMTFSGDNVKSASTLFSTLNKNSFYSQLFKFKSVLDFDCNDWMNSTSIAFIFANNDNFSTQFTSAFQLVFPFVGIFGFPTTQQMYGHYYADNKTHITRNKLRENIDPKRCCVIVMINFEFKKFNK